MRFAGSVTFAPASEWASELRRRALAEPPQHDRPKILDWFRGHSNYYRDRIGDSRSWSDVPPLEKADIADIPVTSPSPVESTRTSGTSGFQVTISNNAWEREFRRALLYRPQLFYGLPTEVTQVVFVDGNDCAKPDDTPKYFAYGDNVYRTWFVGVAAEPDAILDLLKTLRPQLIRGISSGIVRFIESSGAILKDLGVQYVAPGGEYLLPEWRSLIESAFSTEVLDRYGSTESGAIAWQCPFCRRYHANVDEIVIEPDDDGLIVTPLFVMSQPLLRYRLGDRIRFDPSDSGCEIRLPTLTIHEARRDDWIIDGAGRKVSPLSFRFERIPNLDAWRLHQRADGSLTLYFDSTRPEEVGPLLAREMAAAIPGRHCAIETGVWKFSRAGKFKRVSSDCDAPAVAERHP
ncbi:MAG: hypothetical protein KJO76_07625 [Gammaproteobacteria bacterium]|nr:hypothetical protein [Gammaproteobacteria bacterium]MBT8443474.1 hypothetical protein [Gammaproteobacteria bacterium]NND36970.1 hypothetical protein [Gammaproteobacteria bacterium]